MDAEEREDVLDTFRAGIILVPEHLENSKIGNDVEDVTELVAGAGIPNPVNIPEKTADVANPVASNGLPASDAFDEMFASAMNEQGRGDEFDEYDFESIPSSEDYEDYEEEMSESETAPSE